MKVDLLIRTSDERIKFAIEDANVHTIVNPSKKDSAYKIGDKITLNTNEGGEQSFTIKDIKFWVADFNDTFIVEIFI
jgi:hypothetical protein